MPRYFLHLTEGAECIRDLEGMERPCLADARAAALAAAGDIIAEALKHGQTDYQARFDIEDERGIDVLSLSFSCPVRISEETAFLENH